MYSTCTCSINVSTSRTLPGTTGILRHECPCSAEVYILVSGRFMCNMCTLNNGAIQGCVAIVAAWRKSLQSAWQDWRGLRTLSERRRGVFAGCLILQYSDSTYRVIVKAGCHPVAIAQVVKH